MGNQHSNQLNLKQLNKKIKQKSRINLSSLSGNSKNKIKERGSAFLCHSNGSMIANVQFKCSTCSTIKHSAQAIRQHYAKRHNFFESSEQINELEQKDSFYSSDERFKTVNNCTLFIQDTDLIIRCSTLNYGVLKLDESEDQIDNRRSTDQLENDLRVKRINELSKLRQELTKLNAFSRLVESAEKNGPVRGHSIRLKKFDDDSNLDNANSPSISTEDQLNNNSYYDLKNKDKFLLKDKKGRKPPNSASDNTNSSTSSLSQSDAEQTQIDEETLFGLNDLTKEVEQNDDCCSETSSVDTTFGLDAKCTVCHQHNYVVCIQRRLGRMICANCFRFFRHFLSNPVVYACDQLGKCDLNRPIKQVNTHASHNNQQRKLLLTSGTGSASKHVVKQQQLGIFKSKSNTLQSTPKVRRPFQQKELSFYSIVSYSNNNSLSDQSKSMTLNLSSNGKSYSFKERNLSPNQSSLTTPSPTQSNGSFALNKYSTNDLDLNYNSNLNMSNLNASTTGKARCSACWIKKCMDIYYEVEFDDKIMAILNDYHPIQLSALNDESNKNSLQNQQFNQQNNTTLTKQKRYYTNNKLKSKSVSRLYYSAAEKGNTTKDKTSIDQTKTTTLNRKSNVNGLNNATSNKSIVDHSIITAAKTATNDHSKSSSFNGSMNESNCSSSNDSSNSTTITEQQNNKTDLNNENLNKTNLTKKSLSKANLSKSSDKIPTTKLANNSTKKIMTIKNTKLTNNRSNSTSSNTSNSTVNLTSSNELNKNTTKPIVSNKSKNTITLNNLPFKLNNKPIVSKHSTILPSKTTISLSNGDQNNDQPNSTTSKQTKANSNDQLQQNDNNEINKANKIEKSDYDQSNVNNDKVNDTVNLDESNQQKDEKQADEQKNENPASSNGEHNAVDLEMKNDENINKIEINDSLPRIQSNYVTKITTIDNNLNLLLSTNIHNS